MSVMLVVFADYNTMFCCGCWRDRVECVLSGGNDAFRHCERTASTVRLSINSLSVQVHIFIIIRTRSARHRRLFIRIGSLTLRSPMM